MAAFSDFKYRSCWKSLGKAIQVITQKVCFGAKNNKTKISKIITTNIAFSGV